jgi:hypothetical protein
MVRETADGPLVQTVAETEPFENQGYLLVLFEDHRCFALV